MKKAAFDTIRKIIMKYLWPVLKPIITLLITVLFKEFVEKIKEIIDKHFAEKKAEKKNKKHEAERKRDHASTPEEAKAFEEEIAKLTVEILEMERDEYAIKSMAAAAAAESLKSAEKAVDECKGDIDEAIDKAFKEMKEYNSLQINGSTEEQ